MCVALALSACTKKTITPAEDPQPAEVGFTAASQATLVKSDTKDTTPLSNIHPDFGVWGIARQEGASPYILWTEDALTQVAQNTAAGAPDNEYLPVSDAYWFSGYTYNFLAVAPYNDGGLTFGEVVTKEEQTSNNSPSDYLTFTYDMSGKYAAGTYDFDLMAAAAQTSVEKGSAQGAQSLIFWHLFSQITFRVKFGNDQSGNQIVGTVEKLTLKSIRTSASYEITAGDEANTIAVTCTAADSPIEDFVSQTSETIPSNELWSFIDRVNILPQDISDFQLLIDFTIGNGDYDGYEVDLSSAGDIYDFNERYFWNITIGHNLYISLDAVVTPWDDKNGNKYPADGEIIM